jgi:GTP:adenosylcobinamide-phosphate guanylyltransferase
MNVSDKIEYFKQQPVTALVLAGARGPQDPVAHKLGVSNKILAKVGGEPMVLRVLQTLAKSQAVGKKYLCGPSWDIVEANPFLGTLIQSETVQWVEPQQGPSISVRSFLQEYPHECPVFITTADHALLRPEVVDFFLQKAKQVKADVAVGLVPYALVAASYPQSKRTVTRFKGNGFCGCNLFVLLTPNADRLVEFWSRLERDRKHPFRMIRILGWLVLVRYLFGWLSLSEALGRLGRRLDLCVQEILLPFPEAAIDIDTPEDLVLAEEILKKRQKESEEMNAEPG